MATIRYRKIPGNDLLNLQDVDLRVLDMALCDLKDKVKREVANGNAVIGSYDREALTQLHDLVLLIKLGETEDET